MHLIKNSEHFPNEGVEAARVINLAKTSPSHSPAEEVGPNCDIVPSGNSCDIEEERQYQASVADKRKEHDLAEGSILAWQLLQERRERISKRGNQVYSISHVADFLFGPTPLNVVPAGFHYANSKVVEFHHNYIDQGLEAIEACNEPDLPIEEKRKHYGILIHTANVIRKMEKTQKIGGMALGVAACHINEVLTIGIEAKELLFDELIMDACIKKEPHKKTSETLMEAIVEMGDALGLHTQEEQKKLNEPVPENETIVATLYRKAISYIAVA